MRRHYLFVLDRGIVVWLVSIMVLQVIYSNQLVNQARRVDELESMQRKVSDENDIMRTQIATITSLQSLEERAKLLGFVNTRRIISLDVKSFLVALQTAK